MKTVWINPHPSISESEQQEGVEILEGTNVIKVTIHPVVTALNDGNWYFSKNKK